MPFCRKCGRGLPLDAEFCSSCGTRVEERTEEFTNTAEPAPPEAPKDHDDGSARRQEILDNFYLRMKWELKAWSITSKVFTIMGAVFAGISFIMLIATIATWSELSAFLGAYTYVFFVYALVTLPIGIIGMIMKGKVQKYMDGLYYDCGPAVTRGESIGMIVFNYFFNPVGLVFYVINFVYIKTNREDFEEIRRLQLNVANNYRQY